MPPAAPAHVMVVDDDADLLAEISEALREHGFRVSGFTDGERAFRSAARRPPQAILLDLKMRGCSGFRLADLIKKDPRTNSIPVIAMTGYYTQQEHERLMKICGMRACLLKPFTAEVAVQKLEMVIKADGAPSLPVAGRGEAEEEETGEGGI